jgi:hypothetical protein
MQPTIHLQRKLDMDAKYVYALRSKCIVGCIFNSVGLSITREIPCIICPDIRPSSFKEFMTLMRIHHTHFSLEGSGSLLIYAVFFSSSSHFM